MTRRNKKPPVAPPEMIRYEMMAILAHSEPLSTDKFASILDRHRQFLASGGSGGRWETFVTPGGTETGVIVGVYVDQASKDTQGEQADLQHERLDGLDLRGVDLRYANLCGVAARGQDLSGARLDGSLITDADFSGACFRGACLDRADFSRTELTGCDFQNAGLSHTDFDYADLSGSDMSGAKMYQTKLSKAKVDGIIKRASDTAHFDQALRDAAREGDLSEMNAALNRGAKVNARDDNGDTALNLAAEWGHLEAVQRLLAAGADIENLGGADKTPLMNASFAGHRAVVDLLMNRGARVNRDLLAGLLAKVCILEENTQEGMVNPPAAESWRQFLDYMVETWRRQETAGAK